MVRSNRNLSLAVSLSDVVRLTAVVTATGFLAAPPARADEARPTPTTQSGGAASEAAPKQDAPKQEPTPQPTATPARDTTPAQLDPRTVSSSGPALPPATPPSQLRGMREGRRTVDDKPVEITLRDESIESIIPIIHEWTGKYVAYKKSELGNIKLTIVGSRTIPKSQALDFLFQSLKMNNIAVTEMEDMIYLGSITELTKMQPGVVLGPEEDVMKMEDNGLFVTKLFRLKHSRAADVLERIGGLIPEDYAKYEADGDSNQIILSGDIGLAKKVQTLIDMLDVPSWNDFATETFRLQFQDANTIAGLISDLFSDSGAGRSTSGARAQGRNQGRQPVQQIPGAPGATGGGPGAPVVTVLASMNSLTVRATPTQLAEIKRLVATAWDLPPNAKGSIFRTFDLKYADPVKVQELLNSLLGGGSSSRTGVTNRAFAGGRALAPQQAAQGEGSPTAAVANIFSIEAYPDSNRLVVISKTPDNFEWLDRWITELDQPFTSGLPVNVPLKHASAVELSEILNTLLAESGSQGGGLRLPEEGLSGLSNEFQSGQAGQSGATDSSPFSQGGTGNQIQFPWQGGRAGAGAGGTPSEVSALIGRSRVVPNPSQNSVLVMAPPEVEKRVVEIIHQLDKPGRQVMITAVLAEIKVGDGFSWGARVGSGLSAPLNGGDYSVGGGIGLDLTKGGTGATTDKFAKPWFDTSLLTISTADDLAFFLQALSTDTSVRILQQPQVFTSDNKEAKFVAGSDVSFRTGETLGTGTAGTVSSFNQRFVGVGINVRPRITQDNNVAMEVEILLSNLSSNTINTNPVVDRRQTNTTVTVKNGQTIVISGIRREQETQINRRLPFLGDIPLLGAAFSSTERTKETVELVVFLVPVVVENPDSNDDNFNQRERERLRMLQEPLNDNSKDLIKKSRLFESIDTGKSKSGESSEGAAKLEDVPGSGSDEKPGN